MKSTLWWLGLIFSTLSVVMLIGRGFTGGFAAPLALILSYYDAILSALFGPFESILIAGLDRLTDAVDYRLGIDSSWKHILVQQLVLVGALSHRRLQNSGVIFAASNLAIDFAVTLFVSVCWGIAMLEIVFAWRHTPSTNLALLVLLSLAPTALIVFLDARSIDATQQTQGPLRSLVRSFIVFGVCVIGIAAMGTVLDFFPELRAIMTSTEDQARLDDVLQVSVFSFAPAVAYSLMLVLAGGDRARIGWTVLGAFIGAAAFLVTNAGLKLAGL